jgi:hypothetical protein
MDYDSGISHVPFIHGNCKTVFSVQQISEDANFYEEWRLLGSYAVLLL